MEPSAEADQDGGGSVDGTDPAQQATPAPQRPGAGQMPDRLLHQGARPAWSQLWRAQRRSADPWSADPRSGHASAGGSWPARESPINQGDGPRDVKHLSDPRQRQQFVLVAATGPAALTPQQIAVDRGHHHALGGVGVALDVIQHLLVGPGPGPLHDRTVLPRSGPG
jgi:hypothetical protein